MVKIGEMRSLWGAVGATQGWVFAAAKVKEKTKLFLGGEDMRAIMLLSVLMIKAFDISYENTLQQSDIFNNSFLYKNCLRY